MGIIGNGGEWVEKVGRVGNGNFREWTGMVGNG